ncbi:TonB-dependent siderophore receptor [Permianibacter sp. IMCC34836]|uniref:TonB-dependent receptor n=1 Tax=Permianibacter fluminis TaxID=2738515 RepID=UPI0015533DE8|nr:TonB-dependent siderophore receptor [Permianibacter fluminis]NQD38277.1 TonB-dependent siderophore receptor [Permianibacter fluminis]
MTAAQTLMTIKKTKTFQKTPLAAAIALCSALPAYAAEPATSQPADSQAIVKEQETVLKEVKVEAQAEQDGYKANQASSPKLTQPLVDTAKTVRVVTDEVMREQGVTSLRDALRNISGISMAAGEGGVPPGDNLTLRGFSARTDLFIDGARDVAGYTRDPFNLESVEVVEGPGSAFSGRGSTGGSINQVSKAPKLDDFSNAELSIGTDALHRETLDVNKPLESLSDSAALRVNLMNHSADAPGRDEVYSKRWAIAPSLALGLETDTRVVLSHLHQEQDGLPDYGVPYTANVIVPTGGEPLPVDTETFYGLVDRDYEDIDADVTTAKVEHDFSKTVSLRNQLRYGNVTRDSIVTPPRMLNATTVNRQGRARDTEDEILLNQTDLSLKFGEGAIKHTVLVGLELAREKFHNNTRNLTNGPATPINNPNPHDAYTGTITPTGFAEAKADTVALYVFDTIEFGSNWQANLGLRHDDFQTDFYSKTLNLTTNNIDIVDLNNADSTINWNAGLTYKPAENSSIYFAYGSSVNPSAEGLTLSDSTATLDPEESDSYELGTKWDLLNQQLLVTAAIFRTDKTNARTTDGSTGAATVLEGEQRVDGYTLSATGIINENWQVIGSYTHLDSEIVESLNVLEQGNELANVAPESWTLWTTYQLLPSLQVGLGAQHTDRRFNNTQNLNEVPGYTLYDAMASYQVTDSFALRLNVYNLTDEDHYATVGGGHVVPGAARYAMLTGSFSF